MLNNFLEVRYGLELRYVILPNIRYLIGPCIFFVSASFESVFIQAIIAWRQALFGAICNSKLKVIQILAIMHLFSDT